MKQTFSKYYNLILIFVLLIICLSCYCLNIGNYPFLDTDETKFVSIAKEMLNNNTWVNIRLNGEEIFDISPLFFWLTNFSCLVFGKITNITVRLPISIIACFGILVLYFVIKNILKKTYAILISLILSLSLGTLVFARLSTNDLLSSYLMMITILFSYLLIFLKNEKFRTLLWCFVFLFTALSVLSAGLFGFVIPFLSLSAMFIFCGKSRELLKIRNLFPGVIIFLMLVLPWFVVMIHKNGIVFIKEYLFAYDIFKYFGFKEVFYVAGLFLLGFLPWSFSFLWVLGSKSKDIINSVITYFKDNSEDKLKEKWKKLKQTEKFLSLNTILFFTSLIFALIYGSKYTFLILFLMFPAACVSGYYWYDYIVKKKHAGSIFFATLIPDLILIICSLVGLFGHNILNKLIFHGLSHLFIPLIIIFFVIPVIGIFAIILKGRLIVFLSNIILMISLSFVITPSIFSFLALNRGENDLISFAQIANKDKVELAAFISSKKYSLVYYYDNYIKFYDNKDLDFLKKYLKNNPKSYVVVEIKDLFEIEEKQIKYMLLDAGKRYCLIQHMSYDIEKLEDKTEPGIIVY